MVKKAKKTATADVPTFGYVSLARSEYDALVAREEDYQKLVSEHARTKLVNADLASVVDAQGKRLALAETANVYTAQVTQKQKLFIDVLRDGTKAASLEDLSEFWRQWLIHTNAEIDKRKIMREDVLKYEPDLFKTWRNWVNDSGKKDRVFNEAGTRSEREADAPGTVKEMQEHIIMRLRQENAALQTQLRKTEFEMEAYQNEKSNKEKKA